MATDKKAFTMRMSPSNYEKFQSIAKKNRRSMAGELEFIVEQYIDSYESKYGTLSPKVGNDKISGNFNNNIFTVGSGNSIINSANV